MLSHLKIIFNARKVKQQLQTHLKLCLPEFSPSGTIKSTEGLSWEGGATENTRRSWCKNLFCQFRMFLPLSCSVEAELSNIMFYLYNCFFCATKLLWMHQRCQYPIIDIELRENKIISEREIPNAPRLTFAKPFVNINQHFTTRICLTLQILKCLKGHCKKYAQNFFFPFYTKRKIQNSEQENPVGGRDTSNVIFARPTKSRNEGRLHNNRVGIFGTFPNSEITSVLRSVFYVNDKKYLGLNRKQMWHRSQVSGGVCRGVMGRAISPMGLLSLSLPSITFSSHQQ